MCVSFKTVHLIRLPDCFLKQSALQVGTENINHCRSWIVDVDPLERTDGRRKSCHRIWSPPGTNKSESKRNPGSAIEISACVCEDNEHWTQTTWHHTSMWIYAPSPIWNRLGSCASTDIEPLFMWLWQRLWSLGKCEPRTVEGTGCIVQLWSPTQPTNPLPSDHHDHQHHDDVIAEKQNIKSSNNIQDIWPCGKKPNTIRDHLHHCH